MKQLLTLLLLLSVWPSRGQPAAGSPGPAVTVEGSRVRFVETLAGGGGYVGSRRVFEKSRFNTPAASKRFAYNLMEEALATIAGE